MVSEAPTASTSPSSASADRYRSGPSTVAWGCTTQWPTAGFDHFLDAYTHVTAAHARLTPRNAANEIDRLILTAWREKLPVYMELPSDIAYLDIEVPAAPLVLTHTPSDPERLRSCIAAVAARLSAARSPAILVDADADRFGVAPELMAL